MWIVPSVAARKVHADSGISRRLHVEGGGIVDLQDDSLQPWTQRNHVGDETKGEAHRA